MTDMTKDKELAAEHNDEDIFLIGEEDNEEEQDGEDSEE